MRAPGIAGLLGAGLLLAGCGNTGRVLGGVAAVGGMAVSAATTVVGAGVSAVGALAGAGVQAAGAAGSAAAGAVGGATAGGSEAVEVVAVTPASAPAAAPAPTATAMEGLAQPAILAEPSVPGGGGGDTATATLAALGGAGATLAGLRILDTAGAQAVPRAQEMLLTERRPMERCALQVFVSVAGAVGQAQAARFGVWLGDRVRDHGQADAMSSLVEVADEIVATVQDQARQARISAADLLGFDSLPELEQSLALARDAQARCPSAAARRMTELLQEEETEG